MTVSGPDRSIAPPPRLSVLLATQAPVGIVFRRGPSRIVRVIYWDRTKDVFTPGAIFKGRIYVDRSDISPDGRHLLYIAMGDDVGGRLAVGALAMALALQRRLGRLPGARLKAVRTARLGEIDLDELGGGAANRWRPKRLRHTYPVTL